MTGVADSGTAIYVSEVLSPLTGDSLSTSAVPHTVIPAPCGSATSEGDAQLKADQARGYWHLDGSGVSVGVLSDTYDKDVSASTHAVNDVASGDLPGPGNPCGRTTPVQVLDDTSSSGSDEGRGMLQLVHDLAPGASLKFATAFNGDYQMGDNIRARRAQGANVIADDIFYYRDPFFQQGPISVAIDDVTALGAHYFTLGGNHNTIVGGHDVSSWERPAYRSTPCPAGVVSWAASLSSPFAYLDCNNFSPAGVDAGRGFTLANGGTVTLDLQWAQPWFGVTSDIDLLLVDHNTGAVVAVDGTTNTSSGTPFEFIRYSNSSGVSRNLDMVIARYSGAPLPRLKVAMMQPTTGVSNVEYPVSSGGSIVGSTIYGHSGDSNAITVAAVPYNDSSHPENFSSRGPMVTYFGPVVGSTPSAALGSPITLTKPDVAATDGGRTTFFGQLVAGIPRFYGTSAATPHAAAVAALILQRDTQLTQSQLKARMRARATPMPLAPANSVGTGLVNAMSSLAIAPSSPLSVSAVAGNRAAVVRWNASASTGGSAIAQYVATAAPGGRTCKTAARSCTVTGLVPGTVYRFTVTASSIGGTSPASSPSAPMTGGAVPGPVRAPRIAFPRVGQAVLSWAAPLVTGARPITAYQFCVTSCQLLTSWRSTGVTSRGPVASLVMTRLAAGRTYVVNLRAGNIIGMGPALAVRFVQAR